MKSIIKEQLESCKFASIPPFDESTTHLIIPRQRTQGVSGLELEHYYQIELSDYLLNPPPDFSFHINWNGGRVPASKIMRIYPIQKLGNMVRVDGCGYDVVRQEVLEDQYLGLWLPADGFKIQEEIL